MTRTPWSVIPAALAVLFAWPAAAVEQAGVTAAVRGQVDLIPIVDKAKHRAKSGEDVFLGDEISSLDESGMQLMLLDETVFTIGPNTDMTIDDFVYDPATGAGQVTASLAKGVLRFVTGKIAQENPENVVVNLPVGTIGIRGTIGAASYDGTTALVVLLGPGPRNNADERAGRLDVTAAGQTVGLTRPRFGTIIEPGQPPSPPFQLTDAQLNSIVGQLAPKPTGPQPADESEGGAATSLAEQDIAESKVFAEFEDGGGLLPIDPSSVTLAQLTEFVMDFTSGVNFQTEPFTEAGMTVTSLNASEAAPAHLHFVSGSSIGLENHGNDFQGCCSTPYSFALDSGGVFDLISYEQVTTPPSIDVWTSSSGATFSPSGTGTQVFGSGFTGITSATWDVGSGFGDTSLIDNLVFRAASSPSS